MRIARISLVGALLLGAAACQTDDGSAVATKLPPLAFVRYINAVPDTNNLTVRFVDQLEFSPMTFVNVPYRGMGQGNYQALEAGSRHFRVFTYDPRLASGGTAAVTAQMADTTFNFVAGQYYTLLHLGYARTGQSPAQKVYILNDVLPAVNAASVQLRAIHAALGVGAVDIFATTTASTSLASTAPAFANVAFNTTTGYAARTPGSFAAQIAATGTTGSLLSARADTGIAGTSAADPIAGSTIGGSVLTAIAFGAPIAGSPAATFTSSEASGRIIDSVYAVTGGYEVRDSVSAGWGANRFVASANSSYTLTISAPACPAITAADTSTLPAGQRSPVSIKCETRLAAKTSPISANGGNTLRTTDNLAAYLRHFYLDTVKTPAVGTARKIDTVYAVTGGFEIVDSLSAAWVTNQFNQRGDTSFVLTITPAACPTVVAPVTIACEARPAAITTANPTGAVSVRLTGNRANTLIAAATLAVNTKAYYFDTITNPIGNPTVQIVRSARSTFTITRDVARKPLRATVSVTGTNPPSIVWYVDRQPARTTTP